MSNLKVLKPTRCGHVQENEEYSNHFSSSLCFSWNPVIKGKSIIYISEQHKEALKTILQNLITESQDHLGLRSLRSLAVPHLVNYTIALVAMSRWFLNTSRDRLHHLPGEFIPILSMKSACTSAGAARGYVLLSCHLLPGRRG